MVEFCTEKNHNKEAPTPQNQKCKLRSTWEVIKDSEDFKKTTPMTTQPPAPTFSLLQIGQRVVCLVLDKSGSMVVCSLGLGRQDAALTFVYDRIWTTTCNRLGINATLSQNSHHNDITTRNTHFNSIQQKFSSKCLICQIKLAFNL